MYRSPFYMVWPIIGRNAMACGGASQSVRRRLLQLRILCLGFLQDGDVGVGVFPEGEEVLIGFAALGLVAQRDLSAGLAELKLFPFGMAETPTR